MSLPFDPAPAGAEPVGSPGLPPPPSTGAALPQTEPPSPSLDELLMSLLSDADELDLACGSAPLTRHAAAPSSSQIGAARLFVETAKSDYSAMNLMLVQNVQEQPPHERLVVERTISAMSMLICSFEMALLVWQATVAESVDDESADTKKIRCGLEIIAIYDWVKARLARGERAPINPAGLDRIEHMAETVIANVDAMAVWLSKEDLRKREDARAQEKEQRAHEKQHGRPDNGNGSGATVARARKKQKRQGKRIGGGDGGGGSAQANQQ